MIDELKETSSSNNKKDIIKQYSGNEFITKILFYTYNQYFKFFVTSSNCKKLSNRVIIDDPYDNVFDLLDALRSRGITGHKAIDNINAFINKNLKYKDIIYNIIDVY